MERPGAQKGLIEQIFRIPIRNPLAFYHCFPFFIDPAPPEKLLSPFIWDFRDHIEPCPHILTSFGVMRSCRYHSAGPELGPFNILPMEGIQGSAKPFWVPTHFIEGDETVNYIKCGVL